MPYRLKYLELLGYKTFATRTTIAFSHSVTAIVGPNGSGKSNVADSIRWVLGEQSYSLLRGKKTEDMIFTGSELRPRSGMASATITFDNSDNWLPIDYSEVAVTRRAYRDGQNEYLINGQKVRLRDVSELLAQTGLAERTYTVIGQGLVDTALAIRPEERRRLFEEAAGIGLHRSRREESLKRLDTTRRNLERVQDILSELQPRLRSLERQAKRVQEYEQIKSDLKVLLRDWYGYHWHRSQLEVSEAKELARVQEQSLENARLDQSQINEQLNILRNQVREIRIGLNTWHHELSLLHKEYEEANRSIAVTDEREKYLSEMLNNLNTEIARVNEEILLSGVKLDASQTELARVEGELIEAKGQREIAVKNLTQQQSRRSSIDNEFRDARQKLSGLNNQVYQLQARLAERKAQVERFVRSVETIDNGLKKNRQDQTVTSNQLSLSEKGLIAQKNKLIEAENSVQEHRSRQIKNQSEKQKSLEQRGEISTRLAKLEAQLKVLHQAESSLTGYAEGTRKLIDAAQKSRLAGTRGVISRFLDVPEELETAISAALGEFIDAVILDDQPDVALDILLSSNNRGVLLPIKNIQDSPHLSTLPNIDGIIGLATDLCKTSEEFSFTVNLLLGNVVIVKNREAARQLFIEFKENQTSQRNLRRPIRIITLQGEVFFSDGPVVFSGKGLENKTILGRTRQIRELESGIDKAKEEMSGINTVIDGLEKEGKELVHQGDSINQVVRLVHREEETLIQSHNKIYQNLESINRQLAWQEDQLVKTRQELIEAEADVRKIGIDLTKKETESHQEQIALKSISDRLAEVSLDEFQEIVSLWNTNLAVSAKAIEAVNNRLNDLQSTVQAQNNNKVAIETRIKESTRSLLNLTGQRIHLREAQALIQEKINSVQKRIDPAEEEIESLETDLVQFENKEQTARQVLGVMESHVAQTRSGVARRQETLDTLRRRIEEDFGLVNFEYAEDVSGPTPLPLEGMVELLPKISQLSPEIDEAIKRQRAQLRRIGPVNLELLSEYNEVQTRYKFLNEQVSDLEKAELDIRKVIQELDLVMQKEFRKTFDQVALVFKEYFTRLFGGGSARLILTDPDDLTDTGVEIEARLPGRRTQGLSLLSGGERSLTAVALVFALLKVSPTPFCLLDEVDAMLDEANVHRFRDLLKELSQNTQFVIVTHNRNTVQVAEFIYGVTLGRDLASQVLSLKLEEVSKLVGDEP